MRATTLLDLPPELLGQVFEHLRDCKEGQRPICSALLPYTRRNLFHTLLLDDGPSLCRFFRLVFPPKKERKLVRCYTRGDGAPTNHVRCLTVKRINSQPWYTPRLSVLLEMMSSLEELHIRGWYAAASILSHNRITFPRLAKLSIHVVESSSSFFRRNPPPLRILPSFPSLSTINFGYSTWSFRSFRLLSSPLLQHAGSSLSRLAFSLADPGPPMSEVGVALQACQNLEALELTLCCIEEVAELLSAAPVGLQQLSIVQLDEDFGREDHDDLDFTRFARLKSLHLSGQTFAPSFDFLDTLSRADSLQSLTLTFATHPDLHSAKLVDYVLARGGPSRHLSALTFRLPAISTKPRPTKNPDLPDVANGTFSFNRHWSMPLWSAQFSIEDAKRIVEAADEASVRLGGNLRHASKVGSIRDREERYLQTRRDEVLEAVAGLYVEE